ncbi:MAG: transporter substrate-binding protein [Hyphomicrobiales bacterium]|nr:transporter substrate-binding protein [Hyphomicrobiales bacterium]
MVQVILKGVAVALSIVMGASAARAADIRVFASTAMKAAFDELGPLFEQRTGHTLILPYYSSADTRKRMKAGEAFDVAITEFDAFQDLVKEGLPVAEPVTVIAVNAVQLPWPVGGPKPDIATIEKLKAVLMAARSISYSDPALGGGSSVYFQSLIERLGIADVVRAKEVKAKSGQGAVPVAEGRADIGVAQASEIVTLKNLAAVAIMPDDARSRSVYGVGVSAKANSLAAARDFVAFLKSPEGIAGMRRNGLSPN